eukprot:TRINITY_DN2176_c1_g1_i3.p1 TRINITY_DN2176_c1_g1~~TRINITY_DN2176_c1_g1_i3.p1  ORF type:complete len:825 (+),score=273.00 TRINITY_DN2176_c1_g1_i3:2302-4776(+)
MMLLHDTICIRKPQEDAEQPHRRRRGEGGAGKNNKMAGYHIDPFDQQLDPMTNTPMTPIGKGAFGSVFYTKHSDMEYAVKKLNDHFADETSKRELEALMRSACPNVQKLYKSHVHGANLFLYIEYHKMGDLLSHVKRKGPLNEETARTFLADMENGLRHMHETMKMTHRDIKPANILLTCKNGKVMYVIGDLGFSKAAMFGQQTVKGSSIYAPREQVITGAYGPNVDLFALGISLLRVTLSEGKFEAVVVDRSKNLPLHHTNQEQFLAQVKRLKGDIGERYVDIVHRLCSTPDRRMTLNELRKAIRVDAFEGGIEPTAKYPRDFDLVASMCAPAPATLAEAVRGLKGLVPDIQHYAEAAKSKQPNEHQAALALYTFELKKKEDSPYYRLNKALRAPTTAQLLPYEPYLRMLREAFKRERPVKHTVYRGVLDHDRSIQKYYTSLAKGTEVVWPGMTSCSREMGALQKGFFSPTHPSVIFYIEEALGISIAKYSSIPTENELLLFSGARFRVASTLSISPLTTNVQLVMVGYGDLVIWPLGKEDAVKLFSLDVPEHHREDPIVVLAARDGNRNALMQYATPATVNARTAAGWTALHQAVDKGRTDCLRFLLENRDKLKLDLNVKTASGHGQTALSMAVAKGNKEYAELLLQHGADPRNMIETGGLHEACKRDIRDIVDLIANDGDHIELEMLESRNHEGLTPLHVAATECNVECVSSLLAMGVDADALTGDGKTALHLAVINGTKPESRKVKVVEALADTGGCNMNIKDTKGMTPLHFAAFYCNQILFTFLVTKGADMNATYTNPAGRSITASDLLAMRLKMQAAP